MFPLESRGPHNCDYAYCTLCRPSEIADRRLPSAPYSCGEVAFNDSMALQATDPWSFAHHLTVDQFASTTHQRNRVNQGQRSHGKMDRSGEQVPDRAEGFA